MKGLKFLFIYLLLFNVVINGQGSGIPSSLRVMTDANGYLVLVTGSASQTLPLTQTVFTNTRLKTDASGYLQVVLTGSIIPTFPLLGPTQTDCSVVTYSFTGRTTTGLNSHAANTWNLCGGGTLGLSGNTTTVTSSLAFVGTSIDAASGNLTSTGGNILVRNVGQIGTVSRGIINFPSDGVFTLLDSAGTSFSRLQLGGSSSSFPAIKRNGAGIDFRLADDSASTFITANLFVTGTGTGDLGFRDSGDRFQIIRGDQGALMPLESLGVFSTAGIRFDTTFSSANSGVLISDTAPSSPVACTTPTLVFGRTLTHEFDVGSSCTGITTLVYTMPAVNTGWSCDAKNMTNPSTSNPSQTAGSTTSVTITNYARTTGLAADWTAGDNIRMTCTGG